MKTENNRSAYKEVHGFSSYSQRAGPDLPGVLISVVAGQAVSWSSTLAAAVATAAAVTVGRLLQLRNCGISYTVPLFTYMNNEKKLFSVFSQRNVLFFPTNIHFYMDMPLCVLKLYMC